MGLQIMRTVLSLLSGTFKEPLQLTQKCWCGTAETFEAEEDMLDELLYLFQGTAPFIFQNWQF